MYNKNLITVLCLTLVFLGALLIALRTSIYNYGIRTLVTLEPGSSLYKAWIKSPPGVNFDVYVFNWTNPEDFLNHSTKPILKEIGPFKFRQTIEKVNATLHKNNGTMSYYRRRTFVFDQEGSEYGLDVNITFANPVAAGMAHKAKDWSYFTKKGVSFTLRNLVDNEVHVTKPAGEMIFTGYKDPILDAAHSLSFLSDEAPTMDKFAFFYGKNASATFDGIFNVGVGGDHPLGQILSWNYKTNTTFYKPECSVFRGSAGDFFPKNQKSKVLDLFHSDVCRTIVADYEGEEAIHGIDGLKYVLGDHILDNGTLIPGNECTCGEYCLPYGVIYATACKGNSPNYLTLPHFYKADSYFTDKIEGLTPDKKKHEFYIIYEPTTGLPLEMVPRLQINVLLKPISSIGMYEDVPTVLMPLLWFEQTLAMPSGSAFLVKILLNSRDILLMTGILLIIAGILIFVFLFYRMRNSDFRPKEQQHNHNNKNNFLPKELVPLNESNVKEGTC